ncbi:MerR family transcriptional regulator [Levilactobacillus acidifarinae]|uniref:MerR family transcriptional regulator n=1 Tax=Levilactobacillus acidifarinae DSM 19394 = JCM 15949 TaxID=1423715 RepID=A0A0R1LJH5_9LACO|nr:MerR family transcriptional regulator [Levilactobacillus acidifarinae]KRK95951.1 MerR family transcriptional regulator [Levilactobacillus acidifarinae DSM 19394]GEO69257.1 MerR family transcriptional regulator [Levilactobacillus acidifarinae]
MKIETVAHQYHLTTPTLRYYEQEGLLGPVRRINGIRDYQPADLERLDFIVCVKRCGMTLHQIKHFVDIYQQDPATLPERLEILQNQLQVSREKQAQLADSIDHLQDKITDVKALQTTENSVLS